MIVKNGQLGYNESTFMPMQDVPNFSGAQCARLIEKRLETPIFFFST